MDIIKLTESLSVSAQISRDDVAKIAAAGYKVLVNNRPDGEDSHQPAGAVIAAAAAAVGLDYHHMPVTAANFPGPDLAAMTDLFDDSERPVLAFCRSGTRCANLWVAGRATSASENAMQTVNQCGFDLSMASTFIADSSLR
ncbi:MAG: TIGR01244 family sulfur transferase [Halioglobus sp.]|nr:TIGR01244 family sulfur transferase [Halioglobus sp.]